MKEVNGKELLGGIVLIFIETLILGLCVMVIWNYNIPVIFSGVGTLTYPQAVGIYALCKILFTYRSEI